MYKKITVEQRIKRLGDPPTKKPEVIKTSRVETKVMFLNSIISILN